MLRGMPYRIFAMWHDFYEVEPFGTEIDFARSAKICQTMAQLVGNKDARLVDFMPDFENPPGEDDGMTLDGGPKKSVEQMAAIILRAAGDAKGRTG